jgi:hypothetical protein
MMGRKDFRGKWFYDFSLEGRILWDQLLRSANERWVSRTDPRRRLSLTDGAVYC